MRPADKLQPASVIRSSERVVWFASADAQPPKGTSVLAYAPMYPYPKPEKWNFIVADPLTNTVYARAETALVDAEAAGLRTAQRAKQPLLLTGGRPRYTGLLTSRRTSGNCIVLRELPATVQHTPRFSGLLTSRRTSGKSILHCKMPV